MKDDVQQQPTPSSTLELFTNSFREHPAGVAVISVHSLSVHSLGEQHVSLAGAFAQSGAPRFASERGSTAFKSGEPLLIDVCSFRRLA